MVAKLVITHDPSSQSRRLCQQHAVCAVSLRHLHPAARFEAVFEGPGGITDLVAQARIRHNVHFPTRGAKRLFQAAQDAKTRFAAACSVDDVACIQQNRLVRVLRCRDGHGCREVAGFLDGAEPPRKHEVGTGRWVSMRILFLLTLLALIATVPSASADNPDPLCVPTNGGNLDYYSEVCVGRDGDGCRVWHEDWTGRTCYAGH